MEDLLICKIVNFSYSTLIGHSGNIKRYLAYYSGKNWETFPLNESCLNIFMMHLCKSGNSYHSIESHVLSIQFVSKFLGFKSEFSPFSASKKFVSKLAHTNKRFRKPFQKRHVEILCQKVLDHGGLQSLVLSEMRSFVMCLFCYYTLARFDCATNVKLSNIEYKMDYFKITIPFSKTDQSGSGQTVYLVRQPIYDPFMIFCEYLQFISDEPEMYLFPSLKKIRGEWKFDNRKLSYSTAYANFKSLLQKFGLDSTGFSLHSPRIGGTTDAFQKETPAHIIDKRGRWKNPNTKFTYAQDTEEDLVLQISSFT